MHWEKSPPELVAAFGSMLARFPDATQRKMFGYPAAFVGGNMVTSLHVDRWVVRLPDDERARLLELDGAMPFEPMPGRPMKGYATLPPLVVADPDATASWVERAVAFGHTLPPKKG
jgi:TfoX/Sxy family transcriptional regulator of competence genes